MEATMNKTALLSAVLSSFIARSQVVQGNVVQQLL